MPASPDSSLLREVGALRDHLAECLHRLDHVERQLRTEPIGSEPGAMSASADANADLFERALPAEEATGRFTIRAVPLPGAPQDEADPAVSPDLHAHTLHAAGWDVGPSGDGSPDPFAFISVPTESPSPLGSSEVYRGMNALLGGLDVTTPDEQA